MEKYPERLNRQRVLCNAAENLPDALETNCSSCSEAQKRISDKLSHHLIDHRPEDWSLLEEKYDPSGAYRELYLHSRDMDPDESAAGDGDKDAAEVADAEPAGDGDKVQAKDD